MPGQSRGGQAEPASASFRSSQRGIIYGNKANSSLRGRHAKVKVMCQFQGMSTKTSSGNEARSPEPGMGGKVWEEVCKVEARVGNRAQGKGYDNTSGCGLAQEGM